MNTLLPPVIVIIVAGSRIDVLLDCLRSLHNQPAPVDLVLVDNAAIAAGDTAALAEIMRPFHTAKLIRNAAPMGFPENVNLALRHAPGQASRVLLLNDDAIVPPDALRILIEALDSSPRVAAAGPALMNPDNTVQGTFWQFPENRLAIKHALLGYQAAYPLSYQVTDRFWLSGACLLLRLSALEQVGGLDEGFSPGYGEDMDLCYRLLRHGWEIRLCDRARVVHIGGASFGKHSAERYRLFIRGLMRFAAKWYPWWHRELLKAAWEAGIAARLAWVWCLSRAGIERSAPRLAVYQAMFDELRAGPGR